MQSLGIDVKVELTQVVQSHLVGGWNTIRLNIARTLEASDIGSVVLCISGTVDSQGRIDVSLGLSAVLANLGRRYYSTMLSFRVQGCTLPTSKGQTYVINAH